MLTKAFVAVYGLRTRWWSFEQIRCSPLKQLKTRSISSSGATFSRLKIDAMAPAYNGPPVAVIGAGVAGCVCASTLAERGFSVTLIEMGRGPGGRMSQRREITSDGNELHFDHGAQYFTVKFPAVQTLVDRWIAAGLVKEWDGSFGSYDRVKQAFQDETFEDNLPKYVGVPGMNSMCKAMASQPGVKTVFGTTVASLTWKDKGATVAWHVRSKAGDDLGVFGAVVVTDKSLASERFTALTGLAPPLEGAGVPTLYERMENINSVACFTVMVAFGKALLSVPFDRFTIEHSPLLAGAVRVSSKPGSLVSHDSDCWVLHSTIDFAGEVIQREGLSKPSSESLYAIANTLFEEFRTIVPEATTPLFIKAHRWGSAFPIQAVALEEKCIVDSSRRLVACGDYCVGPRIECAIVSGLAAADNIQRLLQFADSKF